jgi:class 3 adenylate cyclase
VSGASHFRGHLFADLRGSTAFTEQAGNAAGAELVRRFRELVRAEVSGYDGAEVKTEGDAIYVVFPSASMAVMCGLAIVDRAAEATAADPQMPIRVGVGVHAGEAVAVPEGGYIGTAVNLAARVCAMAAAGEVLVTGTVRGIAQASIPVVFVARGRRRLKGIAEPVELYLVVPHGRALPSTGRVSRRMLVVGVAAALVLAIVALGAVAFIGAPGAPAATPSPTPPPVVHAPQVGPLDIGQYQTSVFQPRYGFSIVDRGWSLVTETSNATSFIYERDIGGLLDVGRISTVYSNPCAEGGESLPVVNTAQDLADALAVLDFIHLGGQQTISVDDKTGLSLEVTVDPGVLAACDAAGGVAVFQLGGAPYRVTPGLLFKIVSLDVGDSNVSFVAASNGGQDTSVPEIEQFFGVARRLIETVSFS